MGLNRSKTIGISRKPVNALIDAPLTSQSHNFCSDLWIFEFHTFLETGSQDLSRGVKIKHFWGASQVAALQGVPPHKACRGYKRPQAPPEKKKKKKKEERLSWVLLYTWKFFACFLSPPNTFLHTKTPKKNKSKPLDSSLHQKYKVLFLNTTFFPLVLHLGFEV